MKKYIKYIPIVVIVILLLLLVWIGGCQNKKTTQVMNTVNTSVIRDQVIDSVSQIKDKQKIAAIDSVNKIANKKVSDLKNQISGLKDRLNRQELTYQKDTIKVPICDSIIQTSNALIDSLGSEVNAYSLINSNLLDKIKIQSSQNIETLEHLDNAYLNINQLNKQLKTQTNWFHRNEKWIYFGSGVVLTGLILR